MAEDIIGRCLCGQITYRCDEPVTELVLCSCRDCRYITGGEPNAAALVATSALHLMGEVKEYKSLGGSGREISRFFCAICGTPIYTSFSGRPGVLALKSGTLDDQKSLRVSAMIWTGSAPPWHDVGPGAPRFPQGFPQQAG